MMDVSTTYTQLSDNGGDIDLYQHKYATPIYFNTEIIISHVKRVARSDKLLWIKYFPTL